MPEPTPPPRGSLVFAFLPLIAFYVCDAWLGTRVAASVAMVLSAVELAWTWRTMGRIPGLTWLGAGLVFGLGGLSLLDDDPFWMLWSPVLGDALFGGALAWTCLRGQHALRVALEEQEGPLPPGLAAFAERMTWHLVGAMVVHGAWTAWATRSHDLWTWVSGPGQLLIVGVVIAGNVLHARRSGVLDEDPPQP